MKANTTETIRNIPKAIFQYALSIFLFGFLWHLIVELFSIPGYILPSPVKVLATLSQDTAFLIPASIYTIINASIGALAGTTLGIITAVWQWLIGFGDNHRKPILWVKGYFAGLVSDVERAFDLSSKLMVNK